MSKKKRPEEVNEEDSRRSRKEVLIAKKEAEQTRGIRIAIGIVVGLIILIFVIAIVNELIVSPNREVASVDGENISLNDFQDRVEFERAQRIIFLESQLEAFNNDVGIVQQFASQYLIDLAPSSYVPDNPDAFGETIVNQMVNEALIAQAASERGIEVSETDIDEAVGSEFGYYGGGLPTPAPEATETVVPTPSLTPIPTAVITEVLPTATSFPYSTEGPTVTPFPTATPVSEEAFQKEFSAFFQDYQEYGISEDVYREQIQARLLRNLVMDAIAEEQELSSEAEHANFFVIATTDESEADEFVGKIEADGYLPVWNELRSLPFDPESTSTAVAAELLNRTQDDLTQTFGEEVAVAAFEQALDAPSAVITATGQDGTQQYFLIMVSGRDMRELADSALQTLKEEALLTYLEEKKESDVELGNFWRGRVPTLPLLDLKFFAQPTVAPEAIQPEITVEP